ncbi:MAG: Cell division coordinator CpoB [Chlamydiales bacterium]|nr:Cell division coordinator CpoB [Chlamydiales bacterium]MCH9619823.1 Cell division coordinator CpoB [Chlamydiales bacterium]MCH9622750.1 Cell division coordinator CpoB [Chlamydiales bacterium]
MRYFFILIICCSFFWEDDEKEIRSLAKSGLSSMRAENFDLAKEAFQAFLKRSKGERGMLLWKEYVEYYLSYIHVLEVLGERREAQDILSSLLQQHPPDTYLPRIRLTQTRLIADKNSPEKAYLEMSRLATFLPMERWTKEDLSFFHALCYSLDEHFDVLLKKAKRYFVTGYFEEAKVIYEEVLEAICGGYFPKAFLNQELLEKKVRFCLAECHYSMAEYDKTLSLINSDGKGKIDREMIYLMALCFREQKEYEKSIEFFQKYASEGNPGPHYDHALFEIGFDAYRHENFKKARHYFEMLQQLDNGGKPKLVGALYLSRILLQERTPDQVIELLNTFNPNSLKDNPLKYELFYLLGEASFLKDELESAKEFYLRSLPTTMGCEWGRQARFKLGLCYVKLGQFDKGEGIFETLLSSDENEAAAFALARLYLLREDVDREKKITTLFTNRLLSTEKQHEALLLRAESTQDYEKRRALYLKATSQVFEHLLSYLDAWYALGLTEFQHGLLNQEEGALYFERATLAFERAFPLCEKTDSKRAMEILKLEAKANFYCGSPLSSLELLETLLNEFIESCEEHEETLYLRGLVASKLTDLAYFSLAEASYKQVIELYPNGHYVDDALHALGTLYFQQAMYREAKETFLHLANEYPHSPHAAAGWFWAAEAVEKRGGDPKKIATYRENVYLNDPTAPIAAKAYFRRYSYHDYVDGKQEALNHLKELPHKFENSILAIPAHYLLAMRESDFEKAELSFKQVITLFHRSFEEGNLPDTTTIHYYYETLHKLAVLYLKEDKKCNRAIHLLKQVISDFEEKEHPLTSLLDEKILYEQARYSLAKAYLQQHAQTKAEQIFLSMLTHYRESGIAEGLYLALTWREQGKLAMECLDFETALNCFNFADEAGEYFLADEQKLSLWLLKSTCFRKLKDETNAMRMLSKVINADVASPMRIKAMYLRAEIYEMQERPELVIRQLEAITKKGGEWGEIAQKKLREVYGIQ